MAELTRNWRPENRERSRTTSQRGDFAQYTLPDLRLFQNRPLALSARAIRAAALFFSCFSGGRTARDVVRLLYLATTKSFENTQWTDRILAPGAVREAVADCSRAKISEISQENRELEEIFKKLTA